MGGWFYLFDIYRAIITDYLTLKSCDSKFIKNRDDIFKDIFYNQLNLKKWEKIKKDKYRKIIYHF